MNTEKICKWTECNGKEECEKKETTERGNWSHQVEFVLSCIGYAVGLGNIWRFPYLCMRNGGGAFLIPYILFTCLCGIPLLFMEFCMGQFSSLGAVTVWRLCPLFKGVGWASLFVAATVCLYFNIVVSWILYYLFASFTSKLPWASTEKRPSCQTSLKDETNITNFTALCYTNYSPTNFTNANLTSNITSNSTYNKVHSAAEEYFHKTVLELSDGITDLGGIKWQLALCLLLAWLILFLCLIKGIKSSGKVVYITATFPYLFLTILLIRGALLPGATTGIKYYLIPDFSKLLDPKVWQEAALQTFFSLGPGWGTMITFASYNPFKYNCYRDTFILTFVNAFTSFYAGFVVFSVIGNLATLANTDVDKIVTTGPGLAFIVYPQAITQLPISPLWSILFFLMLLTIGLDSQFGILETVASAFADEFPKHIQKRKTLFTGLLCIINFLLGLIMVTRAGLYIFQIIDWYASSFCFMTVALVESIVISWIYGADRFYDEIQMIIGYKPCIWWKICWKFITAPILLAVLIYSMVSMKAPTYGSYVYPPWIPVLGWCLAFISIGLIPLMMIWEVTTKHTGNFIQRLKKASKPQKIWGPGDPNYRAAYKERQESYNSEEATMKMLQL